MVQYIGAIDDSSRSPEKVSKRYVEDAVDALLSGQKPKVNTTKAIGCSIKTLLLYVKAEMHYISVLDDVVFTLYPSLTCFFGFLL